VGFGVAFGYEKVWLGACAIRGLGQTVNRQVAIGFAIGYVF